MDKRDGARSERFWRGNDASDLLEKDEGERARARVGLFAICKADKLRSARHRFLFNVNCEVPFPSVDRKHGDCEFMANNSFICVSKGDVFCLFLMAVPLLSRTTQI